MVGPGLAGEVSYGKARLGKSGSGYAGFYFKEEIIMVYKFKEGSRINADPQVVGQVCEKLSAEGELTAHRLLEESRDSSAPLHNLFEWDDKIAAEEYRISQARHIIRSITVEAETDVKQPVRAFISIHQEKQEYKPITSVIRSVTLREQMLANALRDLRAFKQKYEVLNELASIFSEIDALEESK